VLYLNFFEINPSLIKENRKKDPEYYINFPNHCDAGPSYWGIEYHMRPKAFINHEYDFGWVNPTCIIDGYPMPLNLKSK